MPPKKVNVEESKKVSSTSPRSAKSAALSTKSKGILKNANPIKRSSVSVGRAGDLRKQRDGYAEEIEKEKRIQEEDIRGLLEKIRLYRKENEKLIRQQEGKFGMTLDRFKYVKEELDASRLTNDELYREMESRKDECDKLQAEMDGVLEKINELMIQTTDLQREKRMYEKDKAAVEENETKIAKLTKSNKELRRLLLNNKIDPTADGTKINNVHSSSPKNEPTEGLRLGTKSRFPKIFDRKSLMNYKTSDEIKPLKRPPKGMLRRSRSLNTTKEYVTAREFFTRRLSDTRKWTRVVEVFL